MSPPTRRPALLGATLCAALAVRGGSALAQGQPSRARDCARVGAELDLAVRERIAGRIAPALAVFEDLLQRCPSPQVLVQLSLAEGDAQRLGPAWAHLNQALAATDDPWVRSRRAALIIARTELRARLASLTVQSPTPGASLYLDGQLVGPLPLSEARVLAPGQVRLELRAPGYLPREETVTLTTGQDLALDLALAPEPTAPPVTPVRPPPPALTRRVPTVRYVGFGLVGLGVASLAVGAVMLARTLDQAWSLRTATATSPDPEGAFVRFVTSPGYTATDRSTDTACDAAEWDATPDGQLAASLCADHARTRALAWVFGAVGVAALGTGVALALLRGDAEPRAATVSVSPQLGATNGLVLDATF